MKFFRSIRWRLQLWYGLLLFLILAGFGFTAIQLERSQEFQRIDDELKRRLTLVEEATRPGRNRGPGAESGPGDLNFHKGEKELFDQADGYYYAVWWYGTTLEHSTGVADDIPRPETVDKGRRQRGVFREYYLHKPRESHVVLVGRSISSELAAMQLHAWELSGVAVVVLGFGLVGGWWLVTRAIRPIDDISTTAENISSGNLSHRIEIADAETELGRLAGVLNSTFARLDAAFAQQARFTADAAHELRTPVTVMLTHLQSAVESSCASEEHREAFEACLRAATRMRRLIESLLDLARLDAGQLNLRRQPFELSQVINECVDLVQPLADQRRITIHHQEQTIECSGDPERLGQVILNLLTNAIHYNRDGGEVRVHTQSQPNSVLVMISDTGCGISPEHLAHIFDRFYRVDKARTTSAGRTGLGLAISKAIVEAHQGKLTATSQLGQGTTFTIELPKQ